MRDGSRIGLALLLLLLALTGVATDVLAQAATATVDPASLAADLPPDLYDASVKALVKLSVIAIILEQALALIFDWKPFRETFDRRAVKPLFSFLFAVAIVHQFSLDILATLITAYGGDPASTGLVSKVVTALVLAGGSGGINRILQRLGIRSNLDSNARSAPTLSKAYVAVVPVPKTPRTSYADVSVIAIDSAGTVRCLGTVPGIDIGKDPAGFRSWFLQDKGRFPNSGGFALEPGQWSIRLDGADENGEVTSSAVWGPYQLAAGAIIDLTIKV